MRDLSDEENDYDYRPNELAHLAIYHREKYERIVNSNIGVTINNADSIDEWEQNNLENARKYINNQK